MESAISPVVPVTSMADEFPEEMPSFDREDGLDAEPLVPDGFHVHDEDSASWVVRKITEARAHAAHAKAFADREVARAEREEAFFQRRYGAELEAWTRAQIEGGKRKSVALPGGGVGFRQMMSRVIIDDEPAVLAWAKASHPEAVRVVTKESVDRNRLRDLLLTTGELPESGAHVEPEHDAFWIK